MALLDVPLAEPAVSTPRLRLLDRVKAVRDRMIGDPALQRFAAAFPLTRPVARARAQALFDLTAGFVYSQILYACVGSRLLEALAAGPLDAAAVGRATDLPTAGAARLLRAALPLGLVERRGSDRFGLGEQGAALLALPGVRAMVEHHALLYADLADPLALLRRGGGGGELAGFWPYAAPSDPLIPAQAGTQALSFSDSSTNDADEAYSALMSASQAMVAEQVLAAYPVGRHRRLLDVGGGEGTFLRAVAARAPRPALALLDLPPVAERARARFSKDGLAVEVTAGDAFRDPWPPGADLISLVRVLHDHDDGPAQALLRAARRALDPGGALLIAEPMSETRGAERVGDAYFGLYLLAMGSGRPRPAREIAAMLKAAGFARVQRRATPLPTVASVVVARL
jgi:demethylspheroidene O-methyltransferase